MASSGEPSHLADLRLNMVDTVADHVRQSRDRLGKDTLPERILSAFAKVPRHLFVPPDVRNFAYFDSALPIGWGKTISQPFIAAVMTDLLEPQPTDHILEVGSGRGYHAAVFAELVAEVFTVEIVEELGLTAEATLKGLGYSNIRLRIGDGTTGWADAAPFDKIVLAAAPIDRPERLLDQLKPGGRMVLPLGPEETQELCVLSKDADGAIRERRVFPVRFAALETSR